MPINYDQLSALKAAGFQGDALRKAWAITMRESGGRPTAYNPDTSTGDQSYGLFQINMLGDLGVSRRRQFGLTSNKDLLDPNINAKVAYRMSNGGRDFGAWGIGPNAYRSGAGFDTIKKYYDAYNPGKGLSEAPGAASQTQRTPQAGNVPSQSVNPRKTAIANLLGVALNLSSGGSVDSNVFARQMQAVSPKGTVEPPVKRGPDGAPGLPTAPNPAINRVLAAAHDQVGKPYVFGSGPDTSSFDCSDLIQYAYKQAGIDIPRVTGEQIKVGKTVKWGQFQPGDLIFSNKGGHVTMYVGNGKVIAAPHTGTVVQYQPVSRFKNSFVTAKRIA